MSASLPLPPLLPLPAASAPPRVPGLGDLYRNIWRYAAGARLALVTATSLLIGSQLVKLAVPFCAGKAIDALQSGGVAALSQAGAWVATLLAAQVGVWLLHGPGRVIERRVGTRVREHYADALYAKLAAAPLAWHERQHSGDLQHRMAQATQALSGFAQTQFIYLQSAVNFVGPLVALTALSHATGLTAVLGYVVVGAVIVRFDGALMRLAKRENQAERRYVARLLDFVGNVSTLLSLRLGAHARRLLARRLQDVFEPLQRSIVLNEFKWCCVDLLGAALTWSLVAMFVWRQAGAGGAVLIGTVFMVYQYAQQAGGVVNSLASNFQNFARIRTDFGSADAIWLAPERADDGPAIDPTWQRIDVRDLCFRHAADEGDASAHGLQHIHLSLQRGERIALVGPSGCGKSSLLRVLAGLYAPQHGHVTVDGVAQLGIAHLGSVATLIPQEAEVFEASVLENITFDGPQADGAVERALHVSAFDAVLQTLPHGLQTKVVERGLNLSGGQRQRLCLARGVLSAQGRSVLLLDESTSALDPLVEATVLDRLDAELGDGGCLVASVHKMSLLPRFDRVVLMEAGRIVDAGAVHEVAARQPLLRQMLAGAHGQAQSAAA